MFQILFLTLSLYNTEGVQEVEIEGIPQEEIYAYDMVTQQKAKQTLLELSVKQGDTIQMKSFPNIFFLGKTINEFYNNAIGITSEDTDIQKGKEIFETIKKFSNIILSNQNDLKHEVDLLFENIDKVEMDTESCLEFYGLEEYFKEMHSHVEHDTKYDKDKNKLDMLVGDFNVKLKQFIGSIQSIRYFGDFINFLALPQKKNLHVETKNIMQKIDMGNTLMKGVLGIKDSIDTKLDHLEEGILFGEIFRLNLKNAIDQFKNKEEDIQQFDISGLVVNSGHGLIYIVSIFFVFNQFKIQLQC